MNAQFKKGVLELCVLAQLAQGDKYGYQLTEAISKQMSVAAGTLYLLLRRLNEENYFQTYLVESSEGPARKYYKLTQLGHQHYRQLKAGWIEFVEQVNQLMKEDHDE
jgi:PadR family transcriptional regulator, regulatory protein PadR